MALFPTTGGSDDRGRPEVFDYPWGKSEAGSNPIIPLDERECSSIGRVHVVF